MAGRLYIPPFDLSSLLPDLWQPQESIISPNLAPRRPISIIRQDGKRYSQANVFWGLTPPWLKVLDHAPHCARAETLNQRAMFREAFAARRCLIGVGGIYVWQSRGASKQPYLVTRADRGPLLLAGIWCRFHTSLTEYNDSMALITVPTSPLLSALTDRLPGIIAPGDVPAWLSPATPKQRVEAQLKPAPEELLGAFPVSKQVNDPRHQSAACAYPIGPMQRLTTS
ncbi:SOS response-associated peptidase [Halomonas halocynthiae]|uniref:SOS response-associated peptidase n=1 Tax=Halomonas halocynthiae TaxID=176290 RepID=UPI000429ED0C|nr:SOS response-associated peptidase [Halomonas halocynthiae]